MKGKRGGESGTKGKMEDGMGRWRLGERKGGRGEEGHWRGRTEK